MKVILIEDVKSLGKKGQLVDVNDGYARNFILAKKLGLEATPKNLNDLKLKKANDEKVAKEIYEEAKAFGEEVAKTYNITMEGECLFGHDGVMWLVDAINRAGSADPEAIRDALEQTDVFEGLIGTLVMDPATHNPSMACAVYECHGDSLEFKEIIEAQ